MISHEKVSVLVIVFEKSVENTETPTFSCEITKTPTFLKNTYHVRIQSLRISCKVGVFVISHEKVGVLVIETSSELNWETTFFSA